MSRINRRLAAVSATAILAIASVFAALAAEDDEYAPMDGGCTGYGYALAYQDSGDAIYSSVDGLGCTVEVAVRVGYWNGSTTIYPLGWYVDADLQGQTYVGTFNDALGSGKIRNDATFGTIVTSGFLTP